MQRDVLIDYKLLNQYKKQFEQERLRDLIFPNPSSSLRVKFNTISSIIIGALWVKGYKKLYKISPTFPYKFIGVLSAYSLTYNLSKEFSIGYVNNNFRISNAGIANLFAAVLATSIFVPIGLRGVLEIPRLYYKFCLHFFVANLYWDIYMLVLRKRFLDKEWRGLMNDDI